MSEMNVVPFIDVILVLLVIFMVATPLMNKGLEIQLSQMPEGVDAEFPGEPDLFRIDMAANGEYAAYLQGNDFEAVAFEEVIRRAEAINRNYPNNEGKELKILLSIDQSITHQKLINLVNGLAEVGITDVNYLLTN